MRTWILVGLCVASSLGLRDGDEAPAGVGQAQDPVMPDEAGLKRWQEACKPSKAHKALERFLGDWDFTMSLFFQGPDGPSMKSKGSTSVRWLAEGRWLKFEGRGRYMGQDVQSFQVMGYDNFKHKYVWTAVDDATTHMLRAEGSFDRDGKNLLMYGSMDEPITLEHDKTVKYVWRFKDANTIVYEIHDLPIGETNTKVIEMVFKRRS